MNTSSIRFRLTAWYAIILLAVFAGTGIGIRFAVQSSINTTLDRELHARFEAMTDFVHRQANDPNAGTLVEELAEEDAITPAGAQFRLATAQGHWLYQSTGAKDWGQDPPPTGAETIRILTIQGRRLRVLTAPLESWVVQIGVPLDAFDAMLRRLTVTLLLVSPLVLLLASAGGYWMSGRALRPVARVAQAADAIQANNLSQRLVLRGSGDELDRLSGTLNAMLERLDSAFQGMKRFTADASHELRTPVAVMRAAAELARSKPRTHEEYEHALEQIEAAGERASKLIEDLMVLARADAAPDSPARDSVDLAELARDAFEETRPLAEAKNLTLRADLPQHCPARGDVDSLRRLFLILLDNAVKYNQPGGSIELTLRREPDGEGLVALTEVRDTGIGIAAEHLPHVFERFYRAAKDRSRQTGGAGLGLSIAQQIVTRHRGDISVQSVPASGSVFRVRLPLGD